MARCFYINKKYRCADCIYFICLHTVKVMLCSEHKLYCLAFPESSVNCQWHRVMFSDKSSFSSVNDGLDLVYRTWGENSRYVLINRDRSFV